MAVPELSNDLVPAQPPAAGEATNRNSWVSRGLCGILAVGLLGLFSTAVYSTWVHARDSRRRTDEMNSLKRVGIYFTLYEGKFKSYPQDLPSFELWLQKEGVDTRKLYTCSRCGNGVALFTDAASRSLRSAPPNETLPDVPLAWHRCPLAKDGDEMNVLYFQGRVDVFVVGSASDKALRELENQPGKPR